MQMCWTAPRAGLAPSGTMRSCGTPSRPSTSGASHLRFSLVSMLIVWVVQQQASQNNGRSLWIGSQCSQHRVTGIVMLHGMANTGYAALLVSVIWTILCAWIRECLCASACAGRTHSAWASAMAVS